MTFEPGTIFARCDVLTGVWSFQVLGCPHLPQGGHVGQHTQLKTAEECAMAVRARRENAALLRLVSELPRG